MCGAAIVTQGDIESDDPARFDISGSGRRRGAQHDGFGRSGSSYLLMGCMQGVEWPVCSMTVSARSSPLLCLRRTGVILRLPYARRVFLRGSGSPFLYLHWRIQIVACVGVTDAFIRGAPSSASRSFTTRAEPFNLATSLKEEAAPGCGAARLTRGERATIACLFRRRAISFCVSEEEDMRSNESRRQRPAKPVAEPPFAAVLRGRCRFKTEPILALPKSFVRGFWL